MMSRGGVSLTLLATLSMLGGCTGAGLVTGAIGAARSVDALATPVPQPDARQAYLLGRGGAQALLQRYPVWTEDPAAVRYVNDLGQALALFTTARAEPFRGYRFAILDTPDVVAYALPGAFVFVSRGLLRVAESEEELAAVLAHEIAHVAEGHSVAALQQARRTRQLTTVGAELAGAGLGRRLGPVAGVASSVTGELAAQVAESSYSRDAELDADRVATEILTAAGYPPVALHRLLARLATDERSASSGLFDTHPALDERLKYLADERSFVPSPARQQRFKGALALARAGD